MTVDETELIRKLASEGRLIEAGFVALIGQRPPLNEDQRQILHMAYMAGAEHVFRTIVANTTNAEGTLRPADDYLELIKIMHEELVAWRKFASEHKGTRQ